MKKVDRISLFENANFVYVFAKYIEGVLYGIRPLDPAVMASVAAGLITIALGACLVPASRAARVNPIRALRHE